MQYSIPKQFNPDEVAVDIVPPNESVARGFDAAGCVINYYEASGAAKIDVVFEDQDDVELFRISIDAETTLVINIPMRFPRGCKIRTEEDGQGVSVPTFCNVTFFFDPDRSTFVL